MLGGSRICRILPPSVFRKCGEIQDWPTRPRFHPSTTCGFVGENRVVLGDFRFSPHFRNTRPRKACSSNISGIRDNIQLSRRQRRAVVGKPNNDPLTFPPHVESTATASLRTSYRDVKQSNKATINNAAVRPQSLYKTRGCPPLGRNPLAKLWPIAGFRFLFRTSYRSFTF